MPRTFVGALALTGAALPFACALKEQVGEVDFWYSCKASKERREEMGNGALWGGGWSYASAGVG